MSFCSCMILRCSSPFCWIKFFVSPRRNSTASWCSSASSTASVWRSSIACRRRDCRAMAGSRTE
ncbi:hypothetical protein GUJ93_ZPchr0004g38535 [Zizania palustris]|uniref:Uncharacterized protein n=1 Tax=Zizania palustris TaxID=103762 RepID=A0A8J5S0Y1_ZIZPA|nr:hypothetical protein GUJ93_ZPchr0004g38535 [Zizania palustris]